MSRIGHGAVLLPPLPSRAATISIQQLIYNLRHFKTITHSWYSVFKWFYTLQESRDVTKPTCENFSSFRYFLYGENSKNAFNIFVPYSF